MAFQTFIQWLIRLTKFTLYNHIALITCIYDRKIKFTKNTVGKHFSKAGVQFDGSESFFSTDSHKE